MKKEEGGISMGPGKSPERQGKKKGSRAQMSDATKKGKE